MFPSSWAVLLQDLARLGRGPPASNPCPCPALTVPHGFPQAAVQRWAVPSPLAGNVLLKWLFPKLGLAGWPAVFSIEVLRGPVMGQAAPPWHASKACMESRGELSAALAALSFARHR